MPERNYSEELGSALEFSAERSVVKVTDESGERVFAHSDMVEQTNKPLLRLFKADTLAHLCKWLKQYGNPKESAVYVSPFASPPRVFAFTSEHWKTNRSAGVFELKPSRALTRWLGEVNSLGEVTRRREFTQEQLLKHFQAWGGEVLMLSEERARVKAALCNLQLAAKITYNKKLEDENNLRLEFQIEEQAPAAGAALPKSWELQVPVFEGSDVCIVPARLGYVIPKDGNSPEARFYFESLTLPSIFETEADVVLAKVEELLGNEWEPVIFRGAPSVDTVLQRGVV